MEPGPPVTQPEEAAGGETVNLITAINMALHEVLEAHEDAVVFGEDVARRKGGVFKATQDLTDRFGPERCFNTPIAESSIIGAAIGMAAPDSRSSPRSSSPITSSLRPAGLRGGVSRSAPTGNGTCPWSSAPLRAGIHGALYHSIHRVVLRPRARAEGGCALDSGGRQGAALHGRRGPDPVMFLEPKKLYRLAKGPIRKASIGSRWPEQPSATGEDLTIIAYGAMSHFAVEAASLLEELDISPEVIDLRSLKPLDWPTIEASVKKTSRALIVYEDNEFVGYGAELAAQIADKTFEWLDAPVRRYALPTCRSCPTPDRWRMSSTPPRGHCPQGPGAGEVLTFSVLRSTLCVNVPSLSALDRCR